MKDYDKIIYLSSLSMKGLQAMQNGDYETAHTILEQYGLKPYMLATNKAILQLRSHRAKQLINQGDYKAALAIFEKTLSKLPDHYNSLYNAGVIGYMLENNDKNSSTKTGKWRFYLEKVTNMKQSRQASRIAKNLLEGKTNSDNIPLMF